MVIGHGDKPMKMSFPSQWVSFHTHQAGYPVYTYSADARHRRIGWLHVVQ